MLPACGSDDDGDQNGQPIARRDFTPLTPEQRAAVEREQRAHHAKGDPAAGKTALVKDVEGSILVDARGRVRKKELRGPVERVECEVTRRSVEVYSCTAVTQDLAAVEEAKEDVTGITGHPFTAKIDFETGAYAWCKRNLSPGEGGLIDPRLMVDLPAECTA